MTSKRNEPLSENTDTSRQNPSQDRYRRDARRPDTPSATVYAHPRYVPQLRQIIETKMAEYRQARSDALNTIDQRMQELAQLRNEMDPAVATELMVTLAEARAILLSLNPTSRSSEESLNGLSEKLRTLVKQRPQAG